MGVHGLWELLSPVGRRVSVETLAGKKLAIDASIWMIQFMKAMRDEKGDMVRNAHVLGFFRRICKLLYLRTKPVFVFDGGTPALKRRTVITRRRQRENAQAKIRKTAEKILLNHLKTMKLKELAVDIQKQRQENDIKGKRPMLQEPDNEQLADKRNGGMCSSFDQEKIDEMLAASLAVEENEVLSSNVSTSRTANANEAFVDDNDVDDEDEEMIIPEMHEKVDPAVLAVLPPSMQLDLLVQMRERLMAENRQKYQRVKKAPAQFSELQIEAYLRTVAFRREIDGVQKSAAGRGVGGVQTSRIASEANREFIFSSSFSGDKRILASSGQNNLIPDQDQPQPVMRSTIATDEVLSTNATGEALSTIGTGDVAEPSVPGTGKALDGIETYVDEKGRLRVSRVRALGIRMTRDLQRNLDLMKEIDNGKEINQEENCSGRIPDPEEPEVGNSGVIVESNRNNEHGVVNRAPVEISFEDEACPENAADDGDLFARLVAGEPVMDFSVDKSSVMEPLDSPSDCEWEEGIIGENMVEQKSGEGVSDEGEVEWEEGSQNTQLTTSGLEECHRTVSKGAQEEDADLQEAIRRSLEDTRVSKSSFREILEDHLSGRQRDISHEEVAPVSRKVGPEAEPSASCVSKPFVGSASISSSACSEFVVSKPEPNLVSLKCLNQDPDGKEILTKEHSAVLGTVPGEEVVLISGKKSEDVFTGDDNKNSDSEHTEPYVAVKDGASRLVNSSSADAHHTFKAASDNNLCSSTELKSASAYESNIFPEGVKQVAGEKLDGIASVEMETGMRTNSFVHVNNEQEITKEYLEEEMSFLGKESEQLENKQRKLERNAESVSSEMFAECQELLQMFGLPYIVAPMEAEAQCAFMELTNLVDGVVTDDSDALLFGARGVYKNIFDDRKYVETYFMKDIESELGLDREKLINMALLLGSDYTEGISGIGIVNAVEVVNAFPEKDGLREFREWIESPDPSILGKVDAKAEGSSSKKGTKGGENIQRNSELHSAEGVDREKQIFMEKHRNVSKNWHIPSSFPSEAVVSAYVSPQVDKSTELFSWGKPDIFALRKLCLEKFGWGSSKSDELLLPVLKEYNKHETQLRLEAFYTFNERFAKIRSKRIMKAVKGITGRTSDDLMDATISQKSGRPNKRKVTAGEDEVKGSQEEGTSKAARGRGRGRGKRQSRKESPPADKGGKLEESLELRRSARARKSVSYRASDESDKDDRGSAMKSCEGQAATSNNNIISELEIAGGILEDEAGEMAQKTHEKNITQNGDDVAEKNHLSVPRSSPDDYLQFGGGLLQRE